MIIAILILGFLARLINLNQSLWLDEAIEVLAVRSNSYLDLVSKYSLGDFHPPLYHLLLKFWDAMFGYSEITSRFPSVIFGVLAVYIVYLLGRKLGNTRIGLIAALFMAVNPLAVYYSQEARMYSLAMVAVTAAFYFFLNKKWVWYLFFFAIALYSDYLPFLMFPVFLLLSPNKKKFLILNSLLFLLFLPWLPFFWRQLSIGLQTATAAPLWGQVVGGFDVKALPLTLVKFIIGRISLDNKVLYAIIITPIASLYLWIMTRVKNKDFWLWLVLPPLLGFLLSLEIPVYSYFRFLFVLPAFVLLIAQGAKERPMMLFFSVFVSVISLAIFNLNPTFQREDWRAAVSYMSRQPGVVVMPNLAQAAPIYYYNPAQKVVDRANLIFDNSKTLYLVRYVVEIFDPFDSERKLIEASGYNKVKEKPFNGVLVWKYENWHRH